MTRIFYADALLGGAFGASWTDRSYERPPQNTAEMRRRAAKRALNSAVLGALYGELLCADRYDDWSRAPHDAYMLGGAVAGAGLSHLRSLVDARLDRLQAEAAKLEDRKQGK